MPLFLNQTFESHSGLILRFKIDCDKNNLSDEDLDTLAQEYARTVKDQIFGEIIGIPRGGLRFAKYLNKYIKTDGNITWRTNLIVDDVLTTGKSFQEFWNTHYPNRFSGIRGIVIFARGPCPNWIMPILTLNKIFW